MIPLVPKLRLGMQSPKLRFERPKEITLIPT